MLVVDQRLTHSIQSSSSSSMLFSYCVTHTCTLRFLHSHKYSVLGFCQGSVACESVCVFWQRGEEAELLCWYLAVKGQLQHHSSSYSVTQLFVCLIRAHVFVIIVSCRARCSFHAAPGSRLLRPAVCLHSFLNSPFFCQTKCSISAFRPVSARLPSALAYIPFIFVLKWKWSRN